MAGTFSPYRGFDLDVDILDHFIAPSTALEKGKVVASTPSTKVLAVTNDYGYFVLEEITTDGPSYEERVAGLRQWDVKVDSCVPVLIPRNGAIVRTSQVTAQTGSATLEQICNISGGIYLTASGAGAASVKGVIVGTPTTTGISGVYDVEIRNANGTIY